ncbi:MAG: type II secretion system protein E [Oceanospirillaceae bacterium]|uniref:GspE/PulE family protein n=1 Tax=unclassified Thalassolituus TaxID=2624967 RepID=UPI000C6B1C11|nr:MULTISPECIES: type II/IV secretion system protein [unclassified Thalassolituus]MAX98452.1 type II secretion system protein E [Oceanospirillaceae bacterium]MBL35561.1 type II secretion system protein E [Oceanospirillaceae bacterium]MBS51158.1 type II secretion system protein E [Oceanospirillaceae bacterium]|tara:strand:+ start:878 stop:2650 length:1773 start_codon:yes stop_codon:yes gene_type:complete
MQAQADRQLTLQSLIDDLHRQQLLNDDDYQLALSIRRKQDEVNLHPLTLLGRQGYADARRQGKVLNEHVLTEWLAEQNDMQCVQIDPLEVDVTKVTDLMSYAFAERHRILAVKVQPDTVVVACAEPRVSGWIADLEHVSRRQVQRVLAAPSDIERYRVEFYQLASSVSHARQAHRDASSMHNLESMLELGKAKAPDANDEHIVNIVDWLLQYAFDQRASDIHIEPRRDTAHVRFRIDGVLHNVYDLPAQVGLAVLARIKSLGRMNIAEKRRPQDSRLKTKTPSGQEVELRLSTMPTAFGEKLVMRVFDPDVLVRSFSELGFGKEDNRRWNQMTGNNHGIVFVTGPTGSGKTTTLYSTLKQLATPEVNVSTIEDPIEMVEPSFNQMQVQHGIDLTFASGVRALLRQDPDIIMVGEVRDLETAEIAVQAALTGHLVLSTLHTNDAPSAFTRLLELGLPAYLIRSSVLGVMAQRLVRTLCPHCKVQHKVDEKAWKQLTAPWLVKTPEHVYGAKGCLECRGTGYMGRMGIYEVMPVTDTLEAQIHDQMDHAKLRQAAMKEGMHSLRLSGAHKVAAGLTTIEEVMRVAPLSRGGG